MQRSVAIVGSRGYPSYYGGFETLVRKLAPYLVDAGWAVTVYSRPAAAKEIDETADNRVESVFTQGIESKSLSTLSYGLSSSIAAARRKHDVALVLNCANGYFLPLLKSAAIPTLVNVDGIEWERAKWGRAARAVFKGGAIASARWATQLVFDAEEIGRYWRENFHRDGLYIPYGGDQVRSDGYTPEGFLPRQFALVVARFVPENTIAEFLEAARTLAREMPIIIVGSSGHGGPLEAEVQALANEYGNVMWLGHVRDDRKLQWLWANAAVYFHGHSVGGTNPALVQAMASGAAVVARDTVYNREVLDGAGLFVAPDSKAIEAGLRSVAQSPLLRESLGAAAQIRAESYFTWASVCEKYEAALSELSRK